MLASISLTLLAACATSPDGRMQITAPASVADVYSEVDMQLDLATAGTIRNTCATDCTQQLQQQKLFDQRVKNIGQRLAEGAYAMYPDLHDRVSHFEFEVAEKDNAGTTSNASGEIVVFRGTQKLNPDDTVLALLLAREMGTVIARHHDENSATRIVISMLAAVIFPASNLFNTTTLSQTAMTSTLESTAASTATSYVGSKVALANLKPEQLSEADNIALCLLEQLAWDHHDVAVALAAFPKLTGKDEWAGNFQISADRLQALDATNQAVFADGTPLQEDPQQATASTEKATDLDTDPAPDSGMEPVAAVADPPLDDPSIKMKAILANMEKIGEYDTSKVRDYGTVVDSSPRAKSSGKKLKKLALKHKGVKPVGVAKVSKPQVTAKAAPHVAAIHKAYSVKLAGSSTSRSDSRQNQAIIRLEPTSILVVSKKSKAPAKQHPLPTI